MSTTTTTRFNQPTSSPNVGASEKTPTQGKPSSINMLGTYVGAACLKALEKLMQMTNNLNQQRVKIEVSTAKVAAQTARATADNIIEAGKKEASAAAGQGFTQIAGGAMGIGLASKGFHSAKQRDDLNNQANHLETRSDELEKATEATNLKVGSQDDSSEQGKPGLADIVDVLPAAGPAAGSAVEAKATERTQTSSQTKKLDDLHKDILEGKIQVRHANGSIEKMDIDKAITKHLDENNEMDEAKLLSCYADGKDSVTLTDYKDHLGKMDTQSDARRARNNLTDGMKKAKTILEEQAKVHHRRHELARGTGDAASSVAQGIGATAVQSTKEQKAQADAEAEINRTSKGMVDQVSKGFRDQRDQGYQKIQQLLGLISQLQNHQNQ